MWRILTRKSKPFQLFCHIWFDCYKDNFLVWSYLKSWSERKHVYYKMNGERLYSSLQMLCPKWIIGIVTNPWSLYSPRITNYKTFKFDFKRFDIKLCHRLYESNLYNLYGCSESHLIKSRFSIGQFIWKLSASIVFEYLLREMCFL